MQYFKVLSACVMVLCLSNLSYGQNLIGRVQQLEDLNTQNAKRLATIEDRLAKLEAVKVGVKDDCPLKNPCDSTCKGPCNDGSGQCSCIIAVGNTKPHLPRQDLKSRQESSSDYPTLTPPMNKGNMLTPEPIPYDPSKVRYFLEPDGKTVNGTDGSIHVVGTGVFSNGYTVVSSQSYRSGVCSNGDCSTVGSGGCVGCGVSSKSSRR